MKKYTLIHPTKSGGTAFITYCKKYYNEYFNYDTDTGHNLMCKNNNKPIIVVRDVRSRFLSMYKYWKNGSEIYYDKNNNKNNNKKNISLLDFIYLLKNNKKLLHNFYMWDQHFDNTTKWINNTNYKNIIVIQYEHDLNEKVQSLIDILNIPNKNIPLPKMNISKPIDNEYELDHPEVKKFIEEYFKEDIELINKIKNNPELFKLVL